MTRAIRLSSGKGTLGRRWGKAEHYGNFRLKLTIDARPPRRYNNTWVRVALHPPFGRSGLGPSPVEILTGSNWPIPSRRCTFFQPFARVAGKGSLPPFLAQRMHALTPQKGEHGHGGHGGREDERLSIRVCRLL